MKIKRFLAPDMRTALQHVRQEHGPDAVILSNRVTPEGVEIVAASQYDEDFVRESLDNAAAPATPAVDSPAAEAAAAGDTREQAPKPNEDSPSLSEPSAAPDAPPPELPPTAAMDSAPEQTLAPDAPAMTNESIQAAPAALAQAAPETAPAPTPAAADASEQTPAAEPPVQTQAPATADPTPVPTAAVAADAPWSQFQQELAQMRQMLERGLNHMSDEILRGSLARQQIVDLMEKHGFTTAFTRSVALQIPADIAPQRVRGQVLDLLCERLPLAPANPLDEGGAIALIGPSGAGKTTTLGKLAAHYSARHGVRDIALVSIDNTRPGGNERLHGMARQLGIVVHEADSGETLAVLLQRLADYRLLLIDSAGFAPNDPRAAEQLNWLHAAESVRSLLVLPATTHPVDLDTVVQRFQPASPQGAVLTKLDETARLGGALSVVIEHKLPLTWVSDGQHLHDDLHRAEAASLLSRLDALRRAMDVPYDPVAALVADHAFA